MTSPRADEPASAAPAMPPHKPPPASLLSFFARALRDYQQQQKGPGSIGVLCSVLPGTAPSEEEDGKPQLQPRPPARRPRTLLILDSSFNPPTRAHQRMALSAVADERRARGQLLSRSAERPEGGEVVGRGGGRGVGAGAGVEAEAEAGEEGDEDSRILLLLAVNNADKAPKPAAFPERLAMMYLFAQDLLLRRGLAAAAAAQEQQEVTRNEASTTAACAGAGLGAIDIGVTTEPYFHSKSRAVAASAFYHGDSDGESQGASSRPVEQVYLTGFDTLIRVFDPKYYGGGGGGMESALGPFFAASRLRVTKRTGGDWGEGADQERYLEELARAGGGKLAAEVGEQRAAAWAGRVELVEGRQAGQETVSSTKVRDAARAGDWEALGRLVDDGVLAWIRARGLFTEG